MTWGQLFLFCRGPLPFDSTLTLCFPEGPAIVAQTRGLSFGYNRTGTCVGESRRHLYDHTTYIHEEFQIGRWPMEVLKNDMLKEYITSP